MTSKHAAERPGHGVFDHVAGHCGERGETVPRQPRRSFGFAVACCLSTFGLVGCGGRSDTGHAQRADFDKIAASSNEARDIPTGNTAQQQPSDGRGSSSEAVRPLETVGAGTTLPNETITRPPSPETAPTGRPPLTDVTSSASSETIPGETVSTNPTTSGTTTTNPNISSGVPIDGPGPLTGCTEVRQESPESCTYTLECDGVSVVSTCRWGDDGEWSCYCFGTGADGEQTIPNVDVSVACPSSALFCIEEVAPELGERVCTDVTGTFAGDRCATTLECQRSATLPGGIAVTTHDIRQVECYEASDSDLQCSCSDDSGYKTYAIDGATPDDGCSLTKTLCDSPPEAEVACAVLDQDQEWYCNSVCGQRVTTDAPGVSVMLLNQDTYSYCETDNSGGDWYCSCYDSETVASRYSQVDSSIEAQTACLGAVNICLPGQTFEPEGPPRCSDEFYAFDDWSCSVGGACSQPGTSGEFSLEVRGGYGIYTQCALTDAGAWQCICVSETESPSFTVSGAAGTEACSAAYETCLSSARYTDAPPAGPAFTFDFSGGDAGAN